MGGDVQALDSRLRWFWTPVRLRSRSSRRRLLWWCSLLEFRSRRQGALAERRAAALW